MIGHTVDVEALVENLPALVPLLRAAAFLGVTPKTLRAWRHLGRLRVFKSHPSKPGRVMVPRTEIARLLVEMAR